MASIFKEFLESFRKLLQIPCDEEHVNDLVAVYTVLTRVEAEIDIKKKALRALLMDKAKELGHLTGEKGSRQLNIEGFRVLRECRVSNTPSAEPLRALIREKGLKISEVFDEVKSLEVNPSKLEYLVTTGRLSDSDLETLRPTTYALKVSASPSAQQELDTLLAEDQS